ncbi:hypothetical protein [Mesorhizobium loti]|uniref:hypothetical protein n=1 Tax=Rhizobium loti TaxID=381 RepID=UPI00047DE278|nr:hypothetical protein [Mesorhizobium loti]
MFQHTPWIGTEYTNGLSGCKVVVVGNTHWSEDGEVDDQDCTIKTVSEVCIGAYDKIAFFNQIRGYFGFTDASEFWNRVVFFNYAPRCIGTRANRYDAIPPSLADEAKARFLKILEEKKPDKVFVFSSAVRWMLPVRDVEMLKVALNNARVGRLLDSDLSSPIYMLRHPERASKQEMTETVSALMENC